MKRLRLRLRRRRAQCRALGPRTKPPANPSATFASSLSRGTVERAPRRAARLGVARLARLPSPVSHPYRPSRPSGGGGVLSRGPRLALGAGGGVWCSFFVFVQSSQGAGYWHGVGGFVFNISPSPAEREFPVSVWFRHVNTSKTKNGVFFPGGASWFGNGLPK